MHCILIHHCRGKLFRNRTKWATVRSEIPQGSILGPVLFIIFINSVFNCVSWKVLLSADDAKNYRAAKRDEDAAQLQNDLAAHWNRTQSSLLKINLSKSHQLTLTERSKRVAKS